MEHFLSQKRLKKSSLTQSMCWGWLSYKHTKPWLSVCETDRYTFLYLLRWKYCGDWNHTPKVNQLIYRTSSDCHHPCFLCFISTFFIFRLICILFFTCSACYLCFRLPCVPSFIYPQLLVSFLIQSYTSTCLQSIISSGVSSSSAFIFSLLPFIFQLCVIGSHAKSLVFSSEVSLPVKFLLQVFSLSVVASSAFCVTVENTSNTTGGPGTPFWEPVL